MTRMLKRQLFVIIFFIIATGIFAANSYYTVKKGDTIYAIARKTGASPSAILELNNISNPKKLYVGKRLKIPSKNRTYSSKSKKSSAVNFNWPVRYIRNVARDGSDGVKSIGVYISVNKGAYIKTSADGVVSKIGYVRGYGNYVVVSHASRYMTVYSNLDYIYVKKGQKIKRGSTIGRLSTDKGRFHFQINHAGHPQNAIALLPKR